MTSPLSLAGTGVILGTLLLLYGTVKAVRFRNEPRRVIAWGALHDAGIFLMAACVGTALAGTGLWLFLLFQAAARLLAWFSITDLSPAYGCASLDALDGRGRLKPWTGSLFALGMLAAVGGTPFLLPEARAYIVHAMISGMGNWTSVCALFMAAGTTALVWLHVDTVRRVCLQKASDAEEPETGILPAANDRSLLVFVFGAAVALMGLFRGSMTDAISGCFGITLEHAGTHAAALLYYVGAFVTAAAFLARLRYASWIGAGFALAAMASVLSAAAAPLSQLFLVMITVVGLIVAVYSVGYIHERQGWYWFFLLLTFASLAGIVTATDSTAMFGNWELMTYASYFLVVHEGHRDAYRAGLKYYVMCAGGALFMLPGLYMLEQFAVDPGAAVTAAPLVFQTAAALCLVGFGVKAGLVPFHSWLPDAHPAAPSSVSGPLSGIITKMGFFGLVSFILIYAGRANGGVDGLAGLSWFGTWLTAMGVATLVYGELMALIQQDIKRMLAYSTLGQIGEVALVLGLGTWLATTGALWHMLNHAIMKDLLFLAAGAFILRAGSRKLSDLRGIGRQMPWTACCLAVGLVSIMGLPPFGAFYSKLLMIQASVNAGHLGLAALIFVASLVGAIYYTRILKTIVFEKRDESLPAVKEAPLSMRISMGVLAFLSLLMALAPQLPASLVAPVSSLCFDQLVADASVMQALNISWPIYVIVPVFGAVVPAFFAKDRVKAGRSAVAVMLLTALLVLVFGRSLDTLSYCFALIVPLVGAVNLTYAIGYMEHSHTQWRFYAVFVCMCGGLVGMVSSQYLMGFFLFWEIMSSWTLYMALAHEGDKLSLREAFKYFMFNMAGAGFIFVGLCVVGPFQAFDVSLLERGVTANLEGGAFLGMALLAIGFVMKAAQLPFRIDWQMHPAVAPTPVSGYISSVLLKSALVAMVKLFMLLGGGFALAGALNMDQRELLNVIVMWIGAITIIMAAVKAIMTNGLKLMFIYSTVSQLGYMVAAIGAGTALGYAGGMLHLINHVFFKDLLFLICGAVMFASHCETLDDLGGLGRKMPFTLCMFAIAGLSVVGVPPTSGFSSKWLIYHALMQAGQPLLALLSLFGSVLTLAYIAKFMHAAFLGQPSPKLAEIEEAPRVMRVPMAILAAGCIVTGVFPGLALSPINGILAEYGAQPLAIGLSGVVSGTGAWNATGMCVMMAIAFGAGACFIRKFVILREVDVHTCGEKVETSISRLGPSSLFGGLKTLFAGFAAKEAR